MAATMAAASTPRFSTILSCRGKFKQPSDLEHYLGPHCQRLIVKYKPLSGAHLLFPKERLAVRVYYQGDLAAFQQPPQQSQHAGTQGAEADAREVPISNDDFDNLVAFLKAFETAVVLFVLNPEQQMQQLDDFASPLHRAQRLVQRLSLKPNSPQMKNLRVLLMPSTQVAVGSLIAIADALAPETKERKLTFFSQKEIACCVPNVIEPVRNASDNNANKNSFDSDMDDDSDRIVGRGRAVLRSVPQNYQTITAASEIVAEGILSLATKFNMPDGEADIVMSHLGTIKAIATANEDVLEKLPIEARSKRVIRTFFGSKERENGLFGTNAWPANTPESPLGPLMSVASSLPPPSDTNWLQEDPMVSQVDAGQVGLAQGGGEWDGQDNTSTFYSGRTNAQQPQVPAVATMESPPSDFIPPVNHPASDPYGHYTATNAAASLPPSQPDSYSVPSFSQRMPQQWQQHQYQQHQQHSYPYHQQQQYQNSHHQQQHPPHHYQQPQFGQPYSQYSVRSDLSRHLGPSQPQFGAPQPYHPQQYNQGPVSSIPVSYNYRGNAGFQVYANPGAPSDTYNGYDRTSLSFRRTTPQGIRRGRASTGQRFGRNGRGGAFRRFR